jgi:hypothetical protein
LRNRTKLPQNGSATRDIFRKKAHKNLGMTVANNPIMKATVAQCPILTEAETQPQKQAKAVGQKIATVKVQSPAAVYTAKSIVIIAGIAMMYFVINHGQIFKSYLQW